MPPTALPAWTRRLAADVALYVAIGVVMAFLGPFGSSQRPLEERFVYWFVCMVGGGLIGTAIDEPLRRAVNHFWLRVTMASVLMTPFVTVLVGVTNHVMTEMRLGPENIAQPWFQVFVVSFATMTFRQFAWAHRPVVVEVERPPAEDPAAAFRKRLSAKRRAAALIAVEAEDHYLRVHTDAGEELVTARFGDALSELAGVAGFQTHRSWWVAADAIDEVAWLRGRGEAKLKCGLVVPVSRSNAPALKDAGWF
ncbi:LytTR family DNA-binding domain-containing protein [Phenylobacterium sp. J367]|uniref:LytTR family DNA-binding domain-containing protein n=1 Tax=Phenylobacterium sp. J367 TaxID=2898435 RepID=UPI002151853A|nr:LytTR family DNA-binding domain-containing protein [Phenylobacterium sp. J367]MCR5879104.1 LytTR family transcriptional regulator [Phenylobacterium sp. J367]